MPTEPLIPLGVPISPRESGAAWPVTWSSRWIWTVPPSSISAENHVGYLRRSFALDAVPQSVPARVTADSRYVLWLNGHEVSRGPVRNVPERLAFHEIDLARLLRPGANVIAALVRHYGTPTGSWRRPAPFGEIGHGGFAFEAPSIGLVSDASWRAQTAPWHGMPPGGDPVREVVDGGAAPEGWHEPGFSDDMWRDAVELSAPALGGLSSAPPTPPYSGMEPAGLAELVRLPRPTRIIATGFVPETEGDDPIELYDPHMVGITGHAFTTADVGEMTHGTVCLGVRAEAGTVIDVYVGEDVSEEGLAVVEPRRWAARYVAGGRDGVERFETFDPIGLRYLTAIVRGAGEITELEATERRYPTSGHAAFSCDDDRLERIWAVGRRTLELCATDAFIDCPGREQNAWVGDSYLHTLIAMVTNTDWRLVRRNLRIGAHSRRPDGFLSAIAAGGASTQAFNIPEYSAHWVRSLCRYVERSGDLQLAQELLPTAADVVAAFERHRDQDGLLRVPGIVFVDWAQTERGEATGAVDALYGAALLDYARVCEWTGEPVRASGARAAHQSTKEALEVLWDDERGVYVDALHAKGRSGRRVSQQTNALAIVGNVAPEDRWGRMLDYVLDPARVRVTLSNADLPEKEHWLYQRWEPVGFDFGRHVVAAQPFMRHFLHDAVARAGRQERIAELCLDWLPQVERGNTTFEEFWHAEPGAASRCHAWSATPTYDLTSYVLGVRPVVESAADLGFRRVLVEPDFLHCDRVAGSIPTPHGELHVELTPRSGWLRVPAGVDEVLVRLPSGEHRLGAGHHTLPAQA